MKIAIDARFWGTGHTGLGVYTKNLVEQLSKIDTTNEYHFLVANDFPENALLPKKSSIHKINARAYTFKEQLFIPLFLYLLGPDIVHFTSINASVLYFGKTVITVHDLIKHHSRGTQSTTLPAYVYWFKFIIYRLSFWWNCQKAKNIIVPSHVVERELGENYKNKIIVTHEAAGLDPKTKTEKIDLPEKFAIYTGNAYPHKNLEKLISAWKEVYKKTKVSLVISCGRSVFSSRLEKLISSSRTESFVKYVGFLNDSQLAFAYQKADLYVFPSQMEGFGIPGLDAMEFSLPVVCSDIPVFHEIYGGAAIYFNQADKLSIATQCVNVIEDNSVRQKLIAAGKKQVQKYSWKEMASLTLSAYAAAIEK